MDLTLKDGFIHDGGEDYPVYWGSAQWSLTGDCGNYILDFYDIHNTFNKWFRTAFPCDELYFNTIVMNSTYSEKTAKKGPEPEKKGLVNFLNLHYFEYQSDHIRIWSLDDLKGLEQKK